VVYILTSVDFYRCHDLSVQTRAKATER